MKRILINEKIEIPRELARITDAADIYDSSCSPEARVYYIDRDGGYFLKRAAKSTLAKEAELTRYFHLKGLATEVIDYIENEQDWLLTRKLNGEDCCDAMYLQDPARLCDTIASLLRELHESSFEGCPVQDRTAEYLATADQNHSGGVFDCGFLPAKYKSLKSNEAIDLIKTNAPLLKQWSLTSF